MHRTRWLLALLLIACGNDTTHGGSPPTDPVAGCQQYLSALRGYAARCTGGFDALIYIIVVNQDEVAYSCNQLAAKVSAGTVKYDPSRLAACESEIGSATCGDNTSAAARDCPLVFSGTVAVGGSCTTSNECADGNRCDTTMCPGTCVALTAAGAACTAPDCQQGLFCVGGVCSTAPGTAGQSCLQDSDCASGLYCANGTCAARLSDGAQCMKSSACSLGSSCQGGVCAPQKQPGSSCSTSDDCVASFCASGTCRVGQTAGLGQPCGVTASALVLCSQGYCTATSSMMVGTCQAQVAIGGTCDPTAFLQCVPGATCDSSSNTCKASSQCN